MIEFISELQMQGKEVNLFQPASEFLPMIDEVRQYILVLLFRKVVRSTHL